VSRIKKLTPEQIALFPEYVEKWTKIGLSTEPADRKRAEAGVRLSYKTAGLKPPRIVWCGSPLGNGLTREVVKKLLTDPKFKEKFGASVRSSVRASVRASVRDSVWDSVRASVWDSVRDSVWDSVWASGYGQHDASWISFYYFFRQVCKLEKETEKLVGISEICQSAGWYLPYENICWISERHNILNRDAQGRLHSDGSPAVGYPDGLAIYAWHGVRVPESMGAVRSETWKPEWLLKEKNAEIRRVLIQGLGYGRILKALNAKKIDAWREYELVRISDSVDVEPILLVSMKCPSTGFLHAHRVPPDMKTARNAIQWVNGGVDAEEFICET
jgi:hypothetical protein